MEYKKFGNVIAVRMDKGDEILSGIREISLEHGIKLATVSAIGAVSEFATGIYRAETKDYIVNEFKGDYEIVSLLGNINTMNDEHYSHIHFSASDVNGNVVGGHLNRAIVSATCEMFIHIADGCVDRKFNDEVGLNVLSFE